MPASPFGRAFVAVLYAAALLISVAMIGAVFWPSNMLDTLHFDDVLFLTNLGWRNYLGAVPTVDYNHFLGGVTASSVALAIAIAGPTAKVVEYAALIQMVGLLALLYVVAWRRLSMPPVVVLTALIVTVTLTRAPMEISTDLSSVRAAHSYLYNRFGTCLAIILGVFALAAGRSRAQDAIVGLACGIGLYVLLLTKPTFVVFGPAYLAALVIMGRGAALLGSLAGITFSLVLIDPAGHRVMASFTYAQQQMGERIEIPALIKKSLQLLAVQIVAVVVAISAVTVGLVESGWRFLRPTLAIAALVGGGLLMCATMAVVSLVGHQILPFLVVVPLLVYLVLGDEIRGLRTAALLLPFCLILPHAANMVQTSVRAYDNRHLALISSGPFADYIAYDYPFLGYLRDSGDSSKDGIRDVAYERLLSGAPIDNGVEYVAFAEGIEELRRIEGVEKLGIVTNGRMFDFAFALGAPPVLSYPAFPQTGSPELRSTVPLGPEVDIVMMAKFEGHGMVTEELVLKMADFYAECRTSRHWRIFARRGNGIVGCSRPEAVAEAG